MRAYARFVCAQPVAGAFAFALTYFSSFGQTFFVSLFVPAWLGSFGLTPGGFGALYACATVAGALLLAPAGARLDVLALPRFTTAVLIGLGTGCALLAVSPHAIVLFAALVLLRLCGQGLMTHVAITTMATRFEAQRGIAMSVALLGYSAAEVTLPLLLAARPLGAEWRLWWGVAALLCFSLLAPSFRALARSLPSLEISMTPSRPAAEAGVLAGFRLLASDSRAWLLLPTTALLPLILTALFLYQLPLAASKGWSASWMAGAFTLFAFTRIAASLTSGPWLDRIGPARLVAWSTVPLATSFALLAFGRAPWCAPAFYAIAGVALGASSGASTAVWSDLFGKENLGTVRSFTAALGVLASAAGPIIAGGLLNMGASFPALLLGCVALLALAAFPAFRAIRAIPRAHRIASTTAA